MTTLPAAPEASISRGFWFVFRIGDKVVRAWGSCITGLERVYLDDTLVSERRSARGISNHCFRVNDATYTVQFDAAKIWKGALSCRVLKDEDVVAVQIAKYERPKPRSRTKQILIGLTLGTVAGVSANLITETHAMLVMAIIAAVLIIVVRQPGQFVVKENDA